MKKSTDKKTTAIWSFSCIDNGRKRQSFSIEADTKLEAERTGFRKANKSSKGDIISWKCELVFVK